MCLFKAPKAPTIAPPPPSPAYYNPPQVEVVDQASLDAANRERRRQAAKYGRPSTIIAGLGGGSTPQTGGPKTLLGS